MGRAFLCANRIVGGDPFAVLLTNAFLTDKEFGMTVDLAQAFPRFGILLFSMMEVDGSDFTEYGIVVPNGSSAGIVG